MRKHLLLGWGKDEVLRQVSILVMEKLPEDNYHLLKYVIHFLSRVNFGRCLLLIVWLITMFLGDRAG